ncbi:MAG: RNA polymerase sigma factor [Caldilineaceae bacterium]|nr:RNA polymerase sigma factor [Caldilineaceae bacterium]
MDLSEETLQKTNTQLVERCLNGDDDAWQELVERYANLVHSVPVRYGLTAMEVDDVGQEIFLILAQSLHQIEDPERLPSWLVTTARRATWRVIQKRDREQLIDSIHTDEVDTLSTDSSPLASGQILGASLPTIEELLDGWSYQEAIGQGLKHLEERCRTLIHFLFLDRDEPSYEEISSRLRMPLGSIGPTRNRCLHKLRLILERLGFSGFFK